MNEHKKNIQRGNFTKRSGPIIQGIVETQMELEEAGNGSLYPYIYSLQYALTVECPISK